MDYGTYYGPHNLIITLSSVAMLFRVVMELFATELSIAHGTYYGPWNLLWTTELIMDHGN